MPPFYHKNKRYSISLYKHEQRENQNEGKNKGHTYLRLVGQKGHVDLFHHADVLSTVQLHVVEEVVRAVCWMEESIKAVKSSLKE